MVQSLVADINRQTGESECQYYKDRLLYAEDGQRDQLIDRSRTLSCHGELKNNRGLVSRFLWFHTCHQPQSLLSAHFLLKTQAKYIKQTPESRLRLFAEAPCVPLPGRPGHHQVGLTERPAGQLPAVPPADPHPAAGPGGPRGRRDESGRLHQGSVQQQRAESVHLRRHWCYTHAQMHSVVFGFADGHGSKSL